MKTVSIREYTKHRGLRSHESVRRAIREGRITARPDGRINPGTADKEWQERTRLRRHLTAPSIQSKTIPLTAPKAGFPSSFPSAHEFAGVMAFAEDLFINAGARLRARLSKSTDPLVCERLVNKEIVACLKELAQFKA